MANNPIIGRWKKQPTESLRYEVDWSEWLMPEETLVGGTVHVVENTILGPMELSDPFFLAGNLGVAFFVRGGTTDVQYQVTHRVTTSSGQLAEREILYDVLEA
jgi:hypothetical protein